MASEIGWQLGVMTPRPATGGTPMNMPLTYLVYLAASIATTLWVAHVLHSRGRIFLVDTFHGNQQLADSVNDLLRVGFYLVNVGYVALALRYGTKPNDLAQAIEFLATKLGWVLVILGMMHYANLAVFAKILHCAREPQQPEVPLEVILTETPQSPCLD
jgi:hypothetical protein